MLDSISSRSKSESSRYGLITKGLQPHSTAFSPAAVGVWDGPGKPDRVLTCSRSERPPEDGLIGVSGRNSGLGCGLGRPAADVLNIVDDVTRACLTAMPDTSIYGRRVVREPTDPIRPRGQPGMIVSDSGTELTCNTVLTWCSETRINWHHIAPGKPMHVNRLPTGAPQKFGNPLILCTVLCSRGVRIGAGRAPPARQIYDMFQILLTSFRMGSRLCADPQPRHQYWLQRYAPSFARPIAKGYA